MFTTQLQWIQIWKAKLHRSHTATAIFLMKWPLFFYSASSWWRRTKMTWSSGTGTIRTKTWQTGYVLRGYWTQERRVRKPWCSAFGFYQWLVEKVARDFSPSQSLGCVRLMIVWTKNTPKFCCKSLVPMLSVPLKLYDHRDMLLQADF